MADAFTRFYAAVNAEWPVFKQTPEEAALQERRWRFALQDYSTEALQHAMGVALRTAKKRPSVADFVEWSQGFSRSRSGLSPLTVVPDHLCSCGCGGTKWLRVLRDDDGNVRRFTESAASIRSFVAQAGIRFTAYQQELVESMVGEPLVRMHQQCLKRRHENLPIAAYQIGTEGEIPVFDIPHIPRTP